MFCRDLNLPYNQFLNETPTIYDISDYKTQLLQKTHNMFKLVSEDSEKKNSIDLLVRWQEILFHSPLEKTCESSLRMDPTVADRTTRCHVRFRTRRTTPWVRLPCRNTNHSSSRSKVRKSAPKKKSKYTDWMI